MQEQLSWFSMKYLRSSTAVQYYKLFLYVYTVQGWATNKLCTVIVLFFCVRPLFFFGHGNDGIDCTIHLRCSCAQERCFHAATDLIFFFLSTI
jgi:hypothetical protein